MLGAAVFLSLTAGRQLLGLARRPEAFRAWIDGCGPWAPLCLIGLMCFQVVVAVLPGEPIEIGAGVAFGVWQGLGLCLIGAALGSTICAERTAACKAVSEGHTDFVRIAIWGEGRDYCMPCGACRQFLSEFSTDMEVLCAKAGGRYVSYKLRELLPHTFNY